MLFERGRRKWGKDRGRCVSHHWTVVKSTGCNTSNKYIMSWMRNRKKLDLAYYAWNPSTSTSCLITRSIRSWEWRGVRRHLQSTAGCNYKNESDFSRQHRVVTRAPMKGSFPMPRYSPHRREPCDVMVPLPWEQAPAGSTTFSSTPGHAGAPCRWQPPPLHGKRKKQSHFVPCSEPLPAAAAQQWRRKKIFFQASDFAPVTSSACKNPADTCIWVRGLCWSHGWFIISHHKRYRSCKAPLQLSTARWLRSTVN